MTPEIAVKLLKEARKVEQHLTMVDGDITDMCAALLKKKDARDELVAELRDIVSRETAPLLTDQP